MPLLLKLTADDIDVLRRYATLVRMQRLSRIHAEETREQMGESYAKHEIIRQVIGNKHDITAEGLTTHELDELLAAVGVRN
jgi:hypothetical protein